MATIEKQPESALTLAEWQAADRSKAARYLADRLAETRASYRSVSVATFVLTVTVAAAGWLAFGIVLEHWWLVGGMPVWMRWAWLGCGLTAIMVAGVKWLLPLCRYRVNVLYAARAIEREFPELHNDLINAVLVQPGKTDPHGEVITRSLEQRAARQLTSVPADGVFDKHHLVRLALALALFVIGGTLYALLSPKNPFVTAGRLLVPWAGWMAPSRVTVESVRCYWAAVPTAESVAQADGVAAGRLVDQRRELPRRDGVLQIVRGRQLVVTAAIDHLGAGEIPLLLVTPLLDDGRVDPQGMPWRAELRPQAAGELNFWARLPGTTIGLDRSVRLELVAGDARVPAFDVLAVDAPSVLVREVVYTFPAYTDRPPETLAWQGDIRGLEGADVRLQVEANEPLDAVWVDFLDTERLDDLRLLVDRGSPTRASGSFVLRRTADRSAAEHPSYRLRFRPQAERAAGTAAIIDEPLTHRIEVIPDLSPEVSIDLPEDDPLRVPSRTPVRVRVRAVDPDYAVARVWLETRPQGAAHSREHLLWEPAPEQPNQGAGGLRMSARIVPAEEAHGATILEYRAVVADNRQPEPNTAATPYRRLLVDELAPPPPADDQQWPERRKPPAEPAGPADDGQTEPASAVPQDTPPSEHDADTPPEPPAGQQAPPQRQQPDDVPPAEQGMQDASGAAGPQGGQGQQGEQSGQRQPGQSGAGAKDPSTDPQGSGPSAGEQKGQGQRNAAGGEQANRGADADAGRQQNAGDRRDGQGQPRAAEDTGRAPAGSETGTQNAPGKREDASQEQPGEWQSGQQEREAAAEGDGDANGESAEAPKQAPVDADGTNDGEAMERILDNKRRQAAAEESACCPEEGKPCGKPGCSSCSGGGGAAGGSSGAEGQAGAGGQSAGGERASGQQGTGNGQQQPGKTKPGAAESGNAAQGEPTVGTAGGPGAADGGAPSAGSPQQAGGESSNGESGDSPESQAGAGDEPGQPAAREPAASSEGGPNEDTGAAAGQGAAGSQSAAGEAGPTGEIGDSPRGDTGRSVGGGAIGGQQAAPANGDNPAAESKPLEWQKPELAAVRRATDLALNHLQDSIRSGDEEMLNELGWSREQAEAFLARWQAMQQAAVADEEQQQAYDSALQSLGLRPAGVRTSRRRAPDQTGTQLESRRTQPPLEYRERFKAFQKGTGSGRVETE